MQILSSSGMGMLIYSLLENGQLIHLRLEIGSTFMTQWGPRTVVEHILVPVEVIDDDVPYGC